MKIDKDFIRRLKYGRIKKDVLKYRQLKVECVQKQQFEKAAYYRDIEKRLLDQVDGDVYLIG